MIRRPFSQVGLAALVAAAMVPLLLWPHANLAAKPATPPSRLKLSPLSLKATDLVGDHLMSTASAEKLFLRLLQQDRFLFGEPARGISGGYFSILSPVTIDSTADRALVRLQLELEICHYGNVDNASAKIINFWAFGLLGLALTNGEVVGGQVQWRGTIYRGDEILASAVGRGLATGRRQDLARSKAMPVAHRRAMYDLGTALSNQYWRSSAQGVQPLAIEITDSEYKAVVTEW